MDKKKIILKNVSLSVFYKILNMGIVFITIPLLLNYLEKEQYGIWVTVFSLINIVFFIDGGIGNGLKTKLSSAMGNKNNTLAKEYISTGYVSILFISLFIFFLGFFLIQFFNFQELLNSIALSEKEIKIVLFTLLFFMVTSFVLNLYKPIYYASHQASKVELSMLIYQIIILISIAILLNFFNRSLFSVALVYGISNCFVAICFTYLFFKKHKKLRPNLSSFKIERVKDLMGLSLCFFCIQLCMIIIFTTDNLIISNLLTPIEVTKYDIVFKLFQVLIIMTLIAQDPFWALYNNAYQKKDIVWIRKTIIRLNKIFMLFAFLVGALFLISESVINFWLQRELFISKRLLLLMSFFVLVRVYGIIYMNFLNSIGKVKLQMWLYIFGALINIPLSIFLVKQYNFGSSGVILGTTLSIISMTIFLPYQTFKILKKNELC